MTRRGWPARRNALSRRFYWRGRRFHNWSRAAALRSLTWRRVKRIKPAPAWQPWRWS